jgi:hypothetical protein
LPCGGGHTSADVFTEYLELHPGGRRGGTARPRSRFHRSHDLGKIRTLRRGAPQLGSSGAECMPRTSRPKCIHVSSAGSRRRARQAWPGPGAASASRREIEGRPRCAAGLYIRRGRGAIVEDGSPPRRVASRPPFDAQRSARLCGAFFVNRRPGPSGFARSLSSSTGRTLADYVPNGACPRLASHVWAGRGLRTGQDTSCPALRAELGSDAKRPGASRAVKETTANVPSLSHYDVNVPDDRDPPGAALGIITAKHRRILDGGRRRLPTLPPGRKRGVDGHKHSRR